MTESFHFRLVQKKIALFGTGARHTIKGGTGSGDVNVRENISIAQGLEHTGFKFVTEGWLDQYDRLYADAQEAYVKKLNEFTEKTGKPSMLYAFENPFEEPEQPEITEADVKEADAAIYVISRNSGEEKTAGQRREIIISATENFRISVL